MGYFFKIANRDRHDKSEKHIMAEKFFKKGNQKVAHSILERSKEVQNLPGQILDRINKLIQTISQK